MRNFFGYFFNLIRLKLRKNFRRLFAADKNEKFCHTAAFGFRDSISANLVCFYVNRDTAAFCFSYKDRLCFLNRTWRVIFQVDGLLVQINPVPHYISHISYIVLQ